MAQEPTPVPVPCIVLKTVEELRSVAFRVALANKFVEYGFSRQGGLDWLSDRLEEWQYDVVVLAKRDGEFKEFPFTLHRNWKIVYIAYGNDDGSWHTDLKRFVDVPPKRRANISLILRLQLWDLAFQVWNDPVELQLKA